MSFEKSKLPIKLQAQIKLVRPSDFYSPMPSLKMDYPALLEMIAKVEGDGNMAEKVIVQLPKTLGYIYGLPAELEIIE